MKRILFAIVCLICGIVFCYIVDAPAQFLSYKELIESLEEREDNILSLREEIVSLNSQFDSMKGDNVPKDLPGVMKYITEFDGVEINEIKAFDLDGDTIKLVKVINNPSDKTMCDGYEFNLTVPRVLDFISYFDDSEISYHSVDILFAANNVILRIRTGGGV